MEYKDQDIREIARSGRLIEAIKLYRGRHKVGLADAKSAVEALMAAPPLRPPSDPDMCQEVEDLIRGGQKIKAIVLYREHTGVGLKEAKDAVEAREAELSPRAPVHPASPSEEAQRAGREIEEFLRKRQKIAAIKVYREHTGVGLKEAKDAVETWVPGHSTIPTRPQPLIQEASGPAEGEIDQLVRQGQKIYAIKRYRELKGVGLKEAKDAIDNWPSLSPKGAAHSPPISSSPAPSVLPPPEPAGPSPFDDADFSAEIEMLLRRHLRVEAIRRYREKADAGLGDAMDAIDAFAAKRGL